MVKAHSDSEETGCPHYMYHTSDWIAHTTAFVTPVVEHWLEREMANWVHLMKDRSDDQSNHERTLTTELHVAPLHRSLDSINGFGRFAGFASFHNKVHFVY